MLKLKMLHSLEKVFPQKEPDGALAASSLFQNERFSWQAAFFADKENWGRCEAAVTVEGDLAPYITVKQVGLVPCEFPCYEKADDYLLTEPGMVPDVLKTLDGNAVRYLPRRWESLWLTVDGQGEALPAGKHTVRVSVTADGETASGTVTLEVIPAFLPEQRLLFTQWLHCDGIARVHGAEMFSERFWRVLERYVKTAADYGINLLYTPLFTPPLDTRVGGDRLTCQLVEVTVEDGRYRFGFERLSRWFAMARRCGINRFELSHFFSQWGAKYAPKIMASFGKDAAETRIFGWDTPGGGEEYRRFLAAFLPALNDFLRREGAADSCYLHVSDEPGKEHLEAYTAAAALLKQYLPGYPVMDAMSDYEVYHQSGVSDPVVALNHIEPFLEKNVSPLWGYYCCAQYEAVPNRFLAMPSYRNRVAGLLCYKFGLKGFLQWGYNFYNTQYSLEGVDPYACTDAGRGFPSGDPFSVYPEGEGCTESLRLSVFRDALQDHRALCLLEELTGRAETLAFLERCETGMTFRRYPHSADFLLRFREELNGEIRRRLS